uniref:Forkhead associated phosphopeptide binding domain 1 n=1 Tax=Salvator merianae TaxID=96440 RepID=A0A8D0BW25_SALMN
MKAFLKSSNGILVLRPKITTIGRHEDSDIILKSLGIEDHHAAIEFSDSENSFILRDFNSAYGSYVNDCHIQNAAVKVSPGDVLRFGATGTSFELVVENTPQVSRPPASRRVAWSGQLHTVSETKSSAPAAASSLPFLPSQGSPSASRSWAYGAAGSLPYPLLRKRPAKAWARTVPSPSFSPDAFSRPPTIVPGNGVSVGPLTNIHQGDMLPKERDEVISKLGSEIGRLSAFENECGRKDAVIANLQNELAAASEKLAGALAKKDAEFHHKLLDLEQDVGAKAAEIEALRDQISNLQRNTSEVLYHSLSERDLQIAHWKQENEALKKNLSLTTGLVTSLQKEVTSKEQRIQQMKMDAEKLRRESREKDNQLARVSAQCARIKEETNQELRERTANTYRNQISELELQVKRSKEEIKKCRAQQESLASRLTEKTKSEALLKEECEKRSKQLQEMGRREHLMRSEKDRATTQAQLFRKQVIEALQLQLPEKPLTDQEIIEKIEQIQAASEEYYQKEGSFRKEILGNDSDMEKISENVELLKKELDEFQDFLKTSYCGNRLRQEICNLQNLCLIPPVSGVKSSIVQILCSLLSWVDEVECLLQNVGLDTSGPEKGMSSYMKKLLGRHQDTMSKLQTLQTQLKMAKETQDLLLQEKLKEQKEKLEEEYHSKVKEILEDKKESRKILEDMAALEEARLQAAIAEEKKKSQDLQTQIKQLTEVIELKTKSEEALNAKISEALASLEIAKRRKMVVEEKLTGWEKRLKSLEAENELQKRKHQEEIAEYKEQIRQHSRTIVDLEGKFLESVRYIEKAKEENGRLQKQLEELQSESSQSPPPCSQNISCTEGSYVFLKEELTVAKQELLSKQAIISELKKEISEAKARVSDVIGELNEEQKMELEQKNHLVLSQAHELHQLREKLFELSRLVDQKDADLRTTNEELRNIRQKVKELKAEAEEKAGRPERKVQDAGIQTSPSSLPERAVNGKLPVLDLEDLGARCRGSRHEEIIQRQQEGLAELRQRIKVLERSRPLEFEGRAAETLVVLRKGLIEKQDRKTEQTTQITGRDTNKLHPAALSSLEANTMIERTARLEMADALDFSENMYLTLIQDLATLVNMKELSGMQTVKHLPHDEREEIGRRRQKDLGLLFDKISKLKNRLERRELLLKEYERDLGQFRNNKQALQACKSEMARLADKMYHEAEEKALLKEALERTRLQLAQEKRLNRALKHPKTAISKKPFPENPKTAESPAEVLKKRAHSSASA